MAQSIIRGKQQQQIDAGQINRDQKTGPGQKFHQLSPLHLGLAAGKSCCHA